MGYETRRLELLGPITVNYDDDQGLYTSNPGLLIASLPVGTVVIDVWATLIVPFVSDPVGACPLQIRLGDWYDLFDSQNPDLSDETAAAGVQDPFFDVIAAGYPWSVAASFASQGRLGRFMPVVVIAAGGTPTPAAGCTGLSVAVVTNNTVISGQFQVYALVVTPDA